MWSGSQALLQTISCMKVVGRLCAGGQAVVESQHRFEENVIKLTLSTWVKAPLCCALLHAYAQSGKWITH